MSVRVRRRSSATSASFAAAVRERLEFEKRRLDAERTQLVSEIERRVETLACHETLETLPEETEDGAGDEAGDRAEGAETEGAQTDRSRQGAAEALLHLGGARIAPPSSAGCPAAGRHGWKLLSNGTTGVVSMAVYRCDFCGVEQSVESMLTY